MYAGSLHLGIVYLSFQVFPFTDLIVVALLSIFRLVKWDDWKSSSLQLSISKTD